MNARGFTIIEIMVVLVIIAVLTMIAVPLYKADQTTANRTYAKFQLLNIKGELLRSDLNSPLGITDIATQSLILKKYTAPSYNITIDRTVGAYSTASVFTTFTVIAMPLPANRKDGVLCVDSRGLTAWSGVGSTRCILKDAIPANVPSSLVKLWNSSWDE